MKQQSHSVVHDEVDRISASQVLRIEADTLRRARELLSLYFQPTRLVAADSLNAVCGAKVYLKLESELPMGSFKVRGALYALSATMDKQSVHEVVAASTGNHGAAVAYAAQLLDVSARIFVPANPNPVKRQRILECGAEVSEGGADLSAATIYAREYAQATGAYFLHDATDPYVPVGTATIACEILEQLPGVNVILAPMGDTALIRGLAMAAKTHRPNIEVFGVQAETAPSYYLAWQSGKAEPTATCKTIADGLATREPLEANVAAIRALVDAMYLASDEEMLAAVRHLLLSEHIVAEPSGVAPLVPLLRDPGLVEGKVAVAVVSGANITQEIARRALAME